MGDDKMACRGAPTVSVRTTEHMERCQACGTEVQYQLVQSSFWGFRAGCPRWSALRMKERAIEKLQKDIQKLLLDFQEERGEEIEDVRVDTRNFANLSVEVLLKETTK